MKKLRALTLLAAAIIFGTGCKKDAKQLESPVVIEIDNSIIGSPTIVQTADQPAPAFTADPQFYFDWEHVSTMPSVPNLPKVPVPWAEDAVRMYAEGLRYDFKKSDGWELVYNTYLYDKTFANRYFMMYNKYRGVLRTYIYTEVPPGDSKATTFVNDLKIRFGTSNILSFSDQHIVDVTQSSLLTSVSDPYPARTGVWYISEFELAYDKNLPNTSFLNLLLTSGSSFYYPHTGSVAEKSIDFSKFSLQQQGQEANRDLVGAIQLRIQTDKQMALYQDVLSSLALSRLQQQTQLKAENTNIFNAILVPDLGLTTVKAEVKAKLLSTNYGFLYADPSFSMPGQNLSEVKGITPVFDEVPGIFYLDQKPQVKVDSTNQTLANQYSLNAASVVYRFNPALNAYADIQAISQEIVAENSGETKTLTEANIYHGQIIRSSKPLRIIGVRVNFDVVPKNGSKKIRMIKTFAANLVK